jgi:hypothetical protein
MIMITDYILFSLILLIIILILGIIILNLAKSFYYKKSSIKEE